MLGKSRLKSTMLCIGLIVICMAGCGTADENAAAGENAMADENTNENDMAAITDETAAGKEDGTDTVADEAQDAAENTEEEIALEGLGLSILGDSISAYDGYIPTGFNIFYPISGELTDVSQMWWMRLLDETGMELCANDSSSGSTCAGDSLSTDDPQYGCSGFRISLLAGKQGRMPDVIIIYMGTNDLLNGIPLGDNDGTKLVEEGVIENFSDAYSLILDKIASDYPIATVYCCTLPPIGAWGTKQPFETLTTHLGLTSEDYSERIRVIAENKGVSVIELSDCGIEIDNMGEMTEDGIHFTLAGMEYITQAMLNGLK